MNDNLMGIIVIIFALSCTILPCVVLKKIYKIKHEKKETEFTSYLKKNLFDFKNEKHLELVRKASIDDYFNSLKILTTMLVFNMLALLKMRKTYTICLFSVLLILFLYKWFKKFDESGLKPFTCPKCHGKICWFEKEEQIADGDKNENHKVYYCEKCHYTEKITSSRTNTSN